MTELLYIEAGSVLTGGRVIPDGAMLVEGGRIVVVGHKEQVTCPPGAQQLHFADMLLAPGMIDLQLNGAFGRDFTDTPASIWEVAGKLPRYGVTSFLPTIITSPLSTVEAAQQVMRAGQPSGFKGAMPLGLHLEGPFLNPAKRGAHNPAYLRLPDPGEIVDWSPESGVLLVTLAPELPGALDVVRALVGRGVAVSAGHSMATVEEARAGFEAGITYGTHLFNAMPPLDHRKPGLAGALLAHMGVTAGIIVDGIHVHPDMVALGWRAKVSGHVNLVTDAMAALGMPPGKYMLGDREVTSDGVAARLTTGELAGSVLSLDQAVRNIISFTGCSIESALESVTSVPAALLGITKERGDIAPGLRADMTLFAPDMSVAATFAGGEIVYRADGLS